MKRVAIIQARMGSSRLPGKILLLLNGMTVLEHVITRLQKCSQIDQVIVAIPESAENDLLISIVERQNAGIFRGSESDVLNRYAKAAEAFEAEVIMRVTSDCPLIDPDILSSMFERFAHTTCDYLSNTIVRTFPRGLDAEIFTFEALAKANKEARLAHQREHVTPYIYENPLVFNLEKFTSTPNFSNYRWTLDTNEDWLFLNALYAELNKRKVGSSMLDIVNALSKCPEIVSLNSHIEQKPAVQK